MKKLEETAYLATVIEQLTYVVNSGRTSIPKNTLTKLSPALIKIRNKFAENCVELAENLQPKPVPEAPIRVVAAEAAEKGSSLEKPEATTFVALREDGKSVDTINANGEVMSTVLAPQVTEAALTVGPQEEPGSTRELPKGNVKTAKNLLVETEEDKELIEKSLKEAKAKLAEKKKVKKS